jgi:putative phosphoesterase
VTRVAVVSDTHLPRGARRLPDECLARLRAADAVLHAGDFVRLSVLEELQRLGPPVHAVHGNVDDPDLRALLPERVVVRVDDCSIGIVHDAGRRPGRHARLEAAFPGCAAVVYGHSHVPEVSRTDSGLVVVNPGSPTERRRSASRSMAELHVRRGEVVAELLHLGT